MDRENISSEEIEMINKDEDQKGERPLSPKEEPIDMDHNQNFTSDEESDLHFSTHQR
jgi:hypothetical protein